MEWNEFFKIVSDKKKEKPIWFSLESDPLSSDLEISELEKALSVQLPIEYKKFLKIFGGGYFAFTNVFSDKKDSEWSILVQNNASGLIKTKSFLAVSDNEVGDFYGFKVKNGICESKITFFDHEVNELIVTEYENLYEYLVKTGLKQIESK